MHATVSLVVTLSVVVITQATPYYLPQQRQLFYPVLPQYSQYSQFSQYPQYYPRQVYYAPPAAANLVAPVPAAVRYGPLVAPTPTKQVVYYPGAPGPLPYSGNLVLAGDEGAQGGGGGFLESFTGLFQSYFPWSGESPAPAEEGNASEGSSPASPEKIEQASNSEEPAKEEEGSDKEKENEAGKPAQPAKVQKVKGAPKGAAQKYVVVGQPQFFGNFGLHRANPAAVLPTADHGAVSSYLLLKNFPGVKFAPQVPVVHQVPQVPQPVADAGDAELLPAGHPGAAALGYQKLLQAARQQKEYEDAASVAVDAADPKDAPQDDKPASESEGDSDSDKPEEEETGPTIAQAKPKAIALAGPGGVASAAPVGTALVGPGGMAISAPEATAVAGAKGASSSVISPATTKMASKAMRTYQLATRNLNYLLSL